MISARPTPYMGRGLGLQEAVTLRPNKLSSRPRGGLAQAGRVEGSRVGCVGGGALPPHN